MVLVNCSNFCSAIPVLRQDGVVVAGRQHLRKLAIACQVLLAWDKGPQSRRHPPAASCTFNQLRQHFPMPPVFVKPHVQLKCAKHSRARPCHFCDGFIWVQHREPRVGHYDAGNAIKVIGNRTQTDDAAPIVSA